MVDVKPKKGRGETIRSGEAGLCNEYHRTVSVRTMGKLRDSPSKKALAALVSGRGCYGLFRVQALPSVNQTTVSYKLCVPTTQALMVVQLWLSYIRGLKTYMAVVMQWRGLEFI